MNPGTIAILITMTMFAATALPTFAQTDSRPIPDKLRTPTTGSPSSVVSAPKVRQGQWMLEFRPEVAGETGEPLLPAQRTSPPAR